MKKRYAIPAAGLAATGLTAAGVFVDLIYRFVFDRDRGPLASIDKRSHGDAYYEFRDSKAALLRSSRGFTLSTVSPDGLRLLGFYYPCGRELSRKIAFIVHGYHSEHAETAGMVFEYWHSRGFDVFCPDHRAHGESEGRFIGYDVLESQDCLRWTELLKQTFGQDIEIVLHGFSMGGATVLKMSDRVPENVRFIISDSGYSDASTLISCGAGSPMARLLRPINRRVSGYDIKDSDVRENVKHTRVPILFVHGTDDPTVPFSMGKELYELCPEPKDCLFAPDTKHIECALTVPDKYAEKTDSFIAKYI